MPQKRCCSGQHSSIVQKTHNIGSLRRTDGNIVKKYVFEFFNISRHPIRHICTTCIAFARDQTKEAQKCHNEAPGLSKKRAVSDGDAPEDAAGVGDQLETTPPVDDAAGDATGCGPGGDHATPAAGSHQQPPAYADCQAPGLSKKRAVSDGDAPEDAAGDATGCGPGGDHATPAAGSHQQPPADADCQKTVDQVAEMLKAGSLPQQCINSLASALGVALNNELLLETYNLAASFKDLDAMKSLTPSTWLSERNSALVHFLQNLTVKKGKSQRETSDIRLAHAYENLLGCRNARFVGQWSFSESLVKNSFRQSTSASAVDSAISPSGSTTTHSSFLSTTAADSTTLPDGDIECWFDNNQVVGKTTRVSVAKQSLMSGCTMLCAIQVPGDGLQGDESLKPGAHERVEADKMEEALKQVSEDEKSLHEVYRRYRLQFWEKTVEEVAAEQKSTQFGVEDYVDRMAAQVAVGTGNMTCKHCLTVQRVEFKLCPKCGMSAAPSAVKREDQMHGVPSQHSESVDVVVGEVYKDMPNSYATCKGVLEHIRQQTKIGKDRHWVSVGCDGQPYDICRNLVDLTMVCDICGEVADADVIHEHQSQEHPNDTHVTHKFYDWVLLRPGPGHIEMNMCKVLFRLLWFPVLRSVSKILGFTSDAAQSFIRTCGNHHVTWQILRVILESLAKELAVSFVRHCQSARSDISAEAMLRWAAAAKNNNYVLINKLCDFVLAISLMRAGIRRNNNEAMLAGRQRAAALFFTGPHHTYQRLIVRDMIQRAQVPPSVKRFVEDRASYSASGDATRGEGGDFVLESKNRQTKSWLPPGQPSTTQWQHAARCGDRLEGVKDCVLERCGVSTKTYSEYAIPQEDSIDRVRAELRSSGYLMVPDDSVQFLQGMNGEYLHQDLVNFDVTAKANMDALKGQLSGRSERMEKVFVVPDDESVEKMTKTELVQHLTSTISSTYTGHERDMRIGVVKRTKTKAGLIALIRETVEADE